MVRKLYLDRAKQKLAMNPFKARRVTLEQLAGKMAAEKKAARRADAAKSQWQQ